MVSKKLLDLGLIINSLNLFSLSYRKVILTLPAIINPNDFSNPLTNQINHSIQNRKKQERCYE